MIRYPCNISSRQGGRGGGGGEGEAAWLVRETKQRNKGRERSIVQAGGTAAGWPRWACSRRDVRVG